MFTFRTINSDDDVLRSSPLMRALDFLIKEFAQHPEGLRLTKNLWLNQKLVASAITEIDWPDWGSEEIYRGFRNIKVASEDHFEPFMILHDTLLQLKLVRRHKGHLVPTPLGRKMFLQRFVLFDMVAQYWILEHGFFWRYRESLLGNWDTWLNVLNVEAEQSISGLDLRTILYGPPDSGGYDHEQSHLFNGVLMPLIWIGVLIESFPNGRRMEKREYITSKL